MNDSRRDEYFQRHFHEDQLINHRLTWLIAVNSLLFAGYLALSMHDGKPHGEEIIIARAIRLMPALGIGLSLAIGVGIAAAIWATHCLVAKYRDCEIDCVGVRKETTILGWSSAASLPLIFLASWAILMIH